MIAAATRFIPHFTVGRFQLLVWSGEEHSELFVTKIGRALELIASADPKRFARIERDLRGFALVANGGDVYDDDLRLYVVHLPALVSRSVEEVAMAIVHEATHARLHRAEVRWTEARASRIEHVCVGQEVAFAERLPGAIELVRLASEKLQRRWWTRDKTAVRQDAMLESLKVPRAFIRLRRYLIDLAAKPVDSDH